MECKIPTKDSIFFFSRKSGSSVLETLEIFLDKLFSDKITSTVKVYKLTGVITLFILNCNRHMLFKTLMDILSCLSFSTVSYLVEVDF